MNKTRCLSLDDILCCFWGNISGAMGKVREKKLEQEQNSFIIIIFFLFYRINSTILFFLIKNINTFFNYNTDLKPVPPVEITRFTPDSSA